MGGGRDIILYRRLLIVVREIHSEGGGEVVETLAVSQNNLLPATALAS